jgi:DNA-directed RNA polymerase subunit RPC12/RpoP
MDTGTWTLKCPNCDKSFELELRPTDSIIHYSKETACPHCHRKPKPLADWHHIIGFGTTYPD